MDDMLLRPREVAAMFGVSRTTPYTWISNGSLPAVRLGRALRVRQSAVEAFIARNTVDKLSD
jgi:excisionase family DNA binding protein